jgi:oligopeptide/dipeptide ABC transporter ATP-binding protein
MNEQRVPVSAAASPPPRAGEVILRVEDLTVEFPDGDGSWTRVVDGVSLELRRGEALGVVGESGSGKTMTARSVLGLVPRPGRMRGRVELNGREVSSLRERDWNRIRGDEIGMVFQDAMSGLNPVRTVGSLLVEVIRKHRDLSRGAAREQAIETLSAVGIPNPAERFGVYPHQLSGGLRQRVMIALAIVNQPSVIVADEPTTALDATIQAQILERLRALLSDSGLIMITHDLGVAAALCDRVVVIYAGRVAEVGDAERVLVRPRHPYTARLIRAVPRFDRGRSPLVPISGMPPKPSDVPPSCAFAPRCPNALDHCREVHPPLEEHDGRRVACFNPWGA